MALSMVLHLRNKKSQIMKAQTFRKIVVLALVIVLAFGFVSLTSCSTPKSGCQQNGNFMGYR